MENKIIKVEVKHNRTMFPKFPNILGTEDNTYGIVSWVVIQVLEGEPIFDRYDNLTIVGTYEQEIDLNKTYTILAKETFHEKYGQQYELLFIGEIIDLSNTSNQKGFLQTFLTEGQIIEMYKVLENPLKTIQEHNIEDLKLVHGIGDYIGKCIIERYEDNKDNTSVYIELDDLGLTPKFIQKLISIYKNPQKVVKIVKENPYQLSFDIEGIGFKTADKIALRVGISPKSPHRIKSYINYLLEKLAESGNSFITSNELTGYIFEEFDGKDNILDIYFDEDNNVTGNNISTAINELEEKGILVVENTEIKSERRVYLKRYWNLEYQIAKNLKRISEASNKFNYSNWNNNIKEQEFSQGWSFTNEQKNGIQTGLENQLCFITGGGGTGKSSAVAGMLQALEQYSFAQTALSGKASARLQEVTGKEGSTIHRLLGFKPNKGFEYNEDNQLPHDIIILDEISLVGGDIFLSLVKAIATGTKLFILGDMGQLESIGCINLAHDLYQSNYITTVELLEIHRQAKKSGIITSSKSVKISEPLFARNFEGVSVVGELQDMIFDIYNGTELTRGKVIQYFKKYYESDLVSSVMDIQILAPVKERGDASVLNLNIDVQEYLNPTNPTKKEIKIELDNGKFFYLREGDKILNMKNNYKNIDTRGIETPVFNGWTGILKEIDELFGTVTIFFPIIKTKVIFNIQDAKQSITLGYASTVHKYQGSSAKVVINALDYSTPPNMRTRELLYTMITRAEQLCIVVAQNKAIDDAIKTSGIVDKNTFLVEMLED